MSPHRCDTADRAFAADFHSGRLRPDDFDHIGHLRLAYVLLCERPPGAATARYGEALRAFLATHGIAADKYHATLTAAWVGAVAHFMRRASPCSSFAEFRRQARPLDDSRVMLRHYSARRLYSAPARRRLLRPDRAPIPGLRIPRRDAAATASPGHG